MLLVHQYLYTNADAYVEVRGGAVGIFSIGLTRHHTSGRLERVGTYIGSKRPVSFRYEKGVVTVLYVVDRYLRRRGVRARRTRRRQRKRGWHGIGRV